MGKNPAEATRDEAPPASRRDQQQSEGKFAVVPLRDVDFSVGPRTARRLRRIADNQRLAMSAISKLVLR